MMMPIIDIGEHFVYGNDYVKPTRQTRIQFLYNIRVLMFTTYYQMRMLVPYQQKCTGILIIAILKIT